MKTDAKQRARGLGPSRAEVLEYLRNADAAQPVGAVAAAVGLHENTARFHLDALVESGLVRRDAEPRNQPGRPRVLYRAQPVASEQLYHQLAAALVRHFAGPLEDRGRRAEAAGEAWWAELLAELPAAPVDALPRLVGSLGRLGYQPELLPEPTPSIVVRPCPYTELAAEHPDVVCRMHLGLMRGLLDDTGPWMVEALEPYATADTCIVRLVERAAS
jgi:predicted ArsR family transcriptional regulator